MKTERRATDWQEHRPTDIIDVIEMSQTASRAPDTNIAPDDTNEASSGKFPARNGKKPRTNQRILQQIGHRNDH
jgi:hypothetical protein